MRVLRWLVMVVALAAAGPAVMPLAAQNETPQAARDEYVPLDQLPPEAELPAGPIVVAAYMFVWAAMLVYVFSLVTRIRKVEQDLQALRVNRRP